MALRFYNTNDIGTVTVIYSHYVTKSYATFDEVPPTQQEMAEKIASFTSFFPVLVYEDAEKGVVGYAYASKHKERSAYKWAADISVYITPNFQKKGIGHLLYKSIIEIVKQQGFYTLHAGIALPNEASVGLHTRCGFNLVGVFKNVGYKLDQWRDVGWYQLVLRPPSENPSDPIPYHTYSLVPIKLLYQLDTTK